MFQVSTRTICDALLLLTLLSVGLALPAHAANEDGVFVSNESVLLGGAARSVVSDGSAAWLNPARLTQIERVSVMGNLNALRLSHQRIPRALQVEGDGSLDLQETNVSILPGSMSLGTALNDRLVLGAGVFVTKSQVGNESLHLASTVGDQSNDLVIGVTNRDQDYNAVLALGWKANERSSYGLTLTFRYGRQAYTLANWSIVSNAVKEEISALTIQQQLTRAGLGLIIGGDWQLNDSVVLTAVVQTPMLMLVNSERSLIVDSYSQSGPDDQIRYSVDSIRTLSADARALGSLRMHVGVAWNPDPLLLTGELELRMEPQVSNGGYIAVWNARIGLQHEIKEGVTVGGGIFTDLTQRIPLSEFYDTNVQYLGASVGGRFTKVIRLAPEERTRTIERTTVIGARYMAGIGQFNGAILHLDGSDPTLRNIRYVEHELSLYLGAEFAF